MNALNSNWWKVLFIIITSIIANIILHTISPIESANLSLGEPSIFVKKDMLIPALVVWEVLTFSIFALVFLFIQNGIPGTKLKKGFLYGLSIGGLYFIGMFESALLFDTAVFSEFLMGLPDLVSFMLSGTLLGLVVGTDQPQKNNNRSVWVIFIIALFFVVGRYFAYTLLHISSAYYIKPMGTFVWTLVLGLWVGLIHYLIQAENREKSIWFHGIYFGSIIFGLNWIMNHIFLFTIIEFDFDLLIRSGTDILFTIIGICVFMKFFNKSTFHDHILPPNSPETKPNI